MPVVKNKVIWSDWIQSCLWPTLLGILGAAIGAFLFPLILWMRMDFASGDANIFSIGIGLIVAVATGAEIGFGCGFVAWFIGWGIVVGWGNLRWWLGQRSRRNY